MGSFNNYLVADKEQIFPFRLYLLIGNNKKAIHHLVSDLKNVLECEYEIEEYKTLAIAMDSEDNGIEIEVIWNKVFSDEEKDFCDQFVLNNQINKKVLYDESGEAIYPWRCGTYIFEVRYQSKSFYGAFSIKPKNITVNQFKKIHQLLNEKIQGITEDLMNFSRGFGAKSFLENSHFATFYKWYEKVEKRLLATLENIQKESESNVVHDYMIENIPKHIDSNSIKWQNSPKGFLFKQTKYLNRKYFITTDTANNRMIKAKIIDLQKRLERGKIELNQYLSKQREMIEETKYDLIKIKEELENTLYTKAITISSKKKMESTCHQLEKRLEKYVEEVKQLSKIIDEVKKSRNRLQAVLEKPFWKSVHPNQMKQKTNIRKRSYLLFDKIWKQLNYQPNVHQTEEWLLPVYKPTYVLYEYFVYFVVIECLQSLNFHFPSGFDLNDQLQFSLYKDGLADGTAISLNSVNGRCFIEVIYNDEMELNSKLAIEKNKHFFSTKFRKKPDIKIDLYEICDRQKVYHSSFVLEVKYRPLFNIYQENGSTSTMEQMDEYRGIKYTDSLGNIKHNIIDEVVCVYPGSDLNKRLFNTDYGYFLELYPDDQEGSDILVGENELRELLAKWIERYFPIQS